MPRGGLPDYRKRKEPVLDHVLQYCVDQVGGKCDPQTGRYGIVHWTGVENDDRVKEIIRALYRSAYHLHLSLPYPKVIKLEDGSRTIVIQPANKTFGKKYQLAKGPRSQWAYDPYRKKDQA